MGNIVIRGARQHNLKNISVELPKNKLIVFTGVSGSGKSSLAFDTIYAEGQRRYVESLSSYARQFLGIMDKPDVDTIEGLSPAISIDQKSTSHNPRSTVGTVTEIYDYFRLLFARIGHPHCPSCGREISRQSSAQIIQNVCKQAIEIYSLHGTKFVRFIVLAPIVRDRKGEFSGLFENLRSKGFHHVRVDGHFFDIDEDIVLIKTNKHTIDVVVDRFTLDSSVLKHIDSIPSEIKSRLSESIEQSLVLSSGLAVVGFIEDPGFTFPEKPKKVKDYIYSEKFSCPVCGISISEIEPRTFSFNSPHGACPVCTGLGVILTVDPELIMAKALSLTEGGIIPFAKMFYHDTWYSRLITTVAEAHNIDPKKPLGTLTDEQITILLYGTGERLYRVKGTNRFGEATSIEEPFIGIIPEIKRRYIETQSDFVKMEIEKYMREETCKSCEGKRLKKESLTVTIASRSIADVCNDDIAKILQFIEILKINDNTLLTTTEYAITKPIIKEIATRLTFLIDVGLEYLTLSRAATSLSGGEAQRIRLASQIGSGLTGVLYVLDEPSIGLHPRDNKKLIDTLKHLRDIGNTVIVVEHDREMIESADHIVDFGPGAGNHGGYIVGIGTPEELKSNKQSITAQYLRGTKIIRRPSVWNAKQNAFPKTITLVGCNENNLKHITVSFPTGLLTCVTGASGSGKSTLIVETLYWALHNHINPMGRHKPGLFDRIEGLELVDKTILIDQSPIGRTPRSNPATYTGVFTYIRDLFSEMPAAKMRGFGPGRFSFNVKGGRCEACEGEGQKKIEMQFLSDVYVTCEVCNGKRYSQETLEVMYRGKNIADVLDMTIEEALPFFQHIPVVSQKLRILHDVGLGYMHVGQPATTLSGGEAQRVKLASELMKRATGKTVYILDEPTTGLHFADLEKLLHVLHMLTSYGNTVIVIEHNLDIIKNADWIIDLGPEGGDRGGEVIGCGTPNDMMRNTRSYTGEYLRKLHT